MVIIKINRKLVKLLIAIVLILSLGFNIYSYLHNIQLANKYESIICISNQFSATSLLSFVTSADISQNDNRVIEIFDITKGEVIKKVQHSNSIQKIVDSFLNGISGMYVKVKAFPDKGYIVRIPLNPPVKVQTHWLKYYNINSVDQVFVLFPQQGSPYLLVLDDKLRPYFFNFTGNTEELLKKLDFYPIP